MAAPAQTNSRLGRGLASLIGEPADTPSKLPLEGEQRVVEIEQIAPSPLNPRQNFPQVELEELATSIREKGLVQPLIVRPTAGGIGGYEIVAGERRWRGAQLAGQRTLPVIVRELTDQEVLELAIIENVQRSDLNAIEEARGYSELIGRYDYTQEDLAQVIGKSRSHLANTLRLLKLPEAVQSLVEDGSVSAGHARALVGRDDAEKIALMIVEQGLNVRDVEALVQAADKPGTETPARKRREKDADTKAFERELSDALGLKVEIKVGAGETGILSIKYGNFDQLDYVRQRLLNVDR